MADRIFITGGSGRIGLPLVASLVAEGHDVVCLVRSDQGEQAVVECGAQAVRGTLEDTEALQRGAQGAERIFHLAGGVRGRGSETADVLNRIGTQNLLEVLQGRQDLRSLVLASSCAVYGDRSSLWVEEDFRTSPNTSYGASKVDAEDLCLAALKSSGLPVVIARIGAVYGPSFSFSMADRMQAGRAFLPGEGRNTVPVISITDCVRALTLLSEQGEPGGIYHVSDQSSPSLKEFYEEVHQMVGGQKVFFWSTWIPSYIQALGAELNERLQSGMGQRPRFTIDNLKLYTNSVRLKTHRLEKELGFSWTYPSFREGVQALFSGS